MRTIRTVCTHDGSFHADEALAVFLLKQLYPGIAVTRSRDPAVHEKNDMLVDVGAIYDPSKLRFDHHQRGFTETFSEHHKSTILSSAGLIYKAFGRDVLSLLGVPSIDLETVFLRVYNEFVEGIDGEDNGVPNSLNKYKDNTNLGSRVARLNKAWNRSLPYDSDAAFSQACQLAGEEFLFFVNQAMHEWLPARRIVESSLAKRDGAVVVLERFCPWQDHLDGLIKQQGAEPVYFVIWPDNSDFRVRAVPKVPDSFESLIPLHTDWQGLRGEQLDAASGIPGCIFVHATGFIGANKTLEGAKQMAMKSIALKQ